MWWIIAKANNLDSAHIGLDVDKQIMFIFVFSILLTIKKTILIVKRFILTNFFICSLFIWYLQINKSLLDSKFLINNFSNVQNLNIINVCFVFLIELLFYFWSYLSFKNNLSDWVVPLPNSKDFKCFYKIVIFYFLILIYYLILWF